MMQAKLFDKVSLIILSIIIVTVTIMVFILNSVRPKITADLSLACHQFNFNTTTDKMNQPVSLVYNRLWLEEISVSDFDCIRIKSSPTANPSLLKEYADKRNFTIIPRSSNSRVTIKSNESAFAISDIFINNITRVSLASRANGIQLSLMGLNKSNTHENTVIVSLGDSVYLQIRECQFLNSQGQTIHEVGGHEELLVVPVSVAQPFLIVQDTTDNLVLRGDWPVSTLQSDIEFMKDLEISDVDYMSREYAPGGKLKPLNTLTGGWVKRTDYNLYDSVQVPKAIQIVTDQNRTTLNSLNISTSNLKVDLHYHAESLKLVKDNQAGHELVKSKLDLLLENKTLLAIYSISVVVFGIMLNLTVKRK